MKLLTYPKNKWKISKLNIILLCVFCFIIVYGILVVPNIEGNKVPTNWGPAIDYGREHIIRNGSVVSSSSILEESLTWQSALRKYGSEDVLPKIYFAIINIVTGSTQFPDNLYMFLFIPIGSLILIPLLIMGLYSMFIKQESNKHQIFDLAILFLISVFPISSAVMSGNTNGTVLARAFFILLMFLLLKEKKSVADVAMFCFLLFPFYCYYHTWSYYFGITMGIFFIMSLIEKNTKIMRIAFFSIIVYLVVAIYLNYGQLFLFPLQTLKNMGNRIDFSSLAPTYTSLSDFYSYIQLINAILLLLIALCFVVRYMLKINNKLSIMQSEKIILYTIISIPVVGLFLWVQGGIETFQGRVLEYGIYIVLICTAYLLGSLKSSKNIKVLRCVLIFVLILSVGSYVYRPLHLQYLQSNLSEVEFNGISFVGLKTDDNLPIFSDFRLATPLIYYDKNAIYTIDSPKQIRDGLFEEIMEIYYGKILPHEVLDKVIDSNSYVVITSRRQSEVALSDTSFTAALKPARQNFESNFASDNVFNAIYDTHSVTIFFRRQIN